MKKKKKSRPMTKADVDQVTKKLGVAARKSAKTVKALVELLEYQIKEDPTMHNDEFGDHRQIKICKNSDTKDGCDLQFTTRTGTLMTTNIHQVKQAIVKVQLQGYWTIYLYKPLSTPKSDPSVAYLICMPSLANIETNTRQQWQRDCLVTAIKKRGRGKTHFSMSRTSFTFFDQSIINEVLAHFSLRWTIKVGKKRYRFTKKTL
jgi:hypothetical protein